jgi:hypothetical protein
MANRKSIATPAWSHKNAETGKTEQINRDQVKNMSELDNSVSVFAIQPLNNIDC